MLKKPKKLYMNGQFLPPELLEKLFMHLGITGIRYALEYERTSKVLAGSPDVWNSFCGTHGLSRDTCVKLLKNGNALIKSIKRHLEEIITFQTNQSDMTHLLVCDDLIYVSSDDQSLKAFSYDGCLKKNFIGHVGGIWTFSILKDKPITGSTDKTARIWDPDTEAAVRILKYHRSTIRVLRCCNDFIITGSRDHTIGIWSEIGDLLYRLEGHQQSVRCLDVYGDFLISGSYDGTIKLWDYKKGKFIRDICSHDRRIYCVKAHNGFIASGGHDSDVKINKIDGSSVVSFKYSSSIVAWIDFQGHYVVSSSLDGTVVKFNYVSKKLEFTIQEASPIKCQKVSGNVIIIGTSKEIKIYSFHTGALIRVLLEAYMISKVEMDEWKIIVGFMHEEKYKISVFDYTKSIQQQE